MNKKGRIVGKKHRKKTQRLKAKRKAMLPSSASMIGEKKETEKNPAS